MHSASSRPRLYAARPPEPLPYGRAQSKPAAAADSGMTPKSARRSMRPQPLRSIPTWLEFGFGLGLGLG